MCIFQHTFLVYFIIFGDHVPQNYMCTYIIILTSNISKLHLELFFFHQEGNSYFTALLIIATPVSDLFSEKKINTDF